MNLIPFELEKYIKKEGSVTTEYGWKVDIIKIDENSENPEYPIVVRIEGVNRDFFYSVKGKAQNAGPDLYLDLDIPIVIIEKPSEEQLKSFIKNILISKKSDCAANGFSLYDYALGWLETGKIPDCLIKSEKIDPIRFTGFDYQNAFVEKDELFIGDYAIKISYIEELIKKNR